MKKFLFLVVAVGALFYFKPGFLTSLLGRDGAFDKKGNAQVLVFTGKDCGAPCDSAVQELNARSVPFEEVHLDGNDAAIQRYEKLGGHGIVPYIVAGSHKEEGFQKAILASTLSQAFGDKYLTRAELLYYANHFNPDGTPVIYIYGASWCTFCKAEREELTRRGIKFVEVDVERAPDRAMMEQTMEISGYPLNYVGYERVGGTRTVDPVLDALKGAGKRRI